MDIHWQFLRYSVVGLASSAVLYLMYLWITWLGMGHKTAMSILYAIGVLQTFLFNWGWTFRYQGPIPGSIVRYIMVYALGYLSNLIVLLVLVDKLGLPHQLVQGVMVLLLAVVLFLLQRYWVFTVIKQVTIEKRHRYPSNSG